MAEQVKRKHGDQNSDSDTQYSHKKPGMVACTCNLSTGEMGIETGENWKHAFFFGGGKTCNSQRQYSFMQCLLFLNQA